MHLPVPAAIPYFGETMSLITAIAWALAIIMFKKSGETVHPIGLNFSKDLLAAILFIPTIYIFRYELFRAAPARDYLI
ncbi:MAG TPA: EamA family transporter, partial [candidate division Zixibacteria bacterium]|nr:EamA family transporter [candidate division Zixibacteria bacterium]